MIILSPIQLIIGSIITAITAIDFTIFRITENGNLRVTENGNPRIIEDVFINQLLTEAGEPLTNEQGIPLIVE